MSEHFWASLSRCYSLLLNYSLVYIIAAIPHSRWSARRWKCCHPDTIPPLTSGWESGVRGPGDYKIVQSSLMILPYIPHYSRQETMSPWPNVHPSMNLWTNGQVCRFCTKPALDIVIEPVVHQDHYMTVHQTTCPDLPDCHYRPDPWPLRTLVRPSHVPMDGQTSKFTLC